MSNKGDYIELVRKAQLGDKESMNKLAELARERLRVFAYRLTLREDLSQDIVQETMLEMFKVLGKLKRADRFWPWIYTITYNKIRRHWRAEKRHKAVSIADMDFGDDHKDNQGGLENLVAKELKEVVLSAMQQLKDSHRAVLTMRCYDNMKYSEIAELMGSSELGARMLFLRAKKSLGKHLSRRGLGSGAILTALVVFGKVTAPTHAAASQITVTAATMQVGATASVIGAVASKATLLTLTAAGAIAVGTNMLPESPPVVTPAQQHIIAMNNALPSQSELSQSIENRWDYYPDGRDGALISRLMVSDENDKNSYCQWLQDDSCNYFYNKSENIVYQNNFRVWDSDLRVPVLTTDSQKMLDFISGLQKVSPDFRLVRADGNGLLVITHFDNTINSSNYKTTYHQNVMQEEYFNDTWIEGIQFVDNRDSIHRNGWCYFKVNGQIDGSKVTGTGMLPLYYRYCKEYSPWLKLKVETPQALLIFDSATGAEVIEEDRGLVATYPAGAFFKGISRQWMGLHTIDTIRRDAAQKQIMFETTYDPDQVDAQVSVLHGRTTLVYTIDMEKDLIEKIEFLDNSAGNQEKCGSLEFTYLDEFRMTTREFKEPSTRRSRRLHRDALGISWLSQLAEGKLAD